MRQGNYSVSNINGAQINKLRSLHLGWAPCCIVPTNIDFRQNATRNPNRVFQDNYLQRSSKVM